MRRLFSLLYLRAQLVSLQFRRAFLGFDNANCHLSYCDSRLLPDALRWMGAHVGDGCVFESPLIINTRPRDGYCNLTIGDGCYFGKNVLLDIKGKIVIGHNVTISMGCSLISHLDVGRSKLSHRFPTEYGQIRIGCDCYLGANAMVLMDVELGEGCLVGAGAVVNRSVPARTMVAGVPARLIRHLSMPRGKLCGSQLEQTQSHYQ
jgi:acetyltransferase-like isoleucine patch superfamily enzyme